MQGLMILKIHVCLESSFFSLCRFPVGFQLMVAVALLDFPRPVLQSPFCGFLALVCALHAGIILFDRMDFVMYQNPGFLCGAG